MSIKVGAPNYQQKLHLACLKAANIRSSDVLPFHPATHTLAAAISTPITLILQGIPYEKISDVSIRRP